MQINKNRKGLALSAVFALVASLFAGLAPAQANESAAVVYPAVGTETQTSTFITEEYDLKLRFGTGVAAFYRDYTNEEASETAAGWGLKIVKGDGVTISTKIDSGTAVSHVTGTEVYLMVPSSSSTNVAISVSDKTSVSAAVSLTVTAWLDLDRDGLLDAGEPVGNTMTLNFVPWSAAAPAITVSQPNGGDHGATASFSVTPGTLNWGMLEHDFAIRLVSTNDGTTTSAPITPENLSDVDTVSTSGTTATVTSGRVTTANFSASMTVITAPFTTSGAVQSVSAHVLYNSVSMAVSTLAVSAVAAENVTISAVAGANAVLTGANAADARFNSAFTVRAYAHSASATTSIGVASAISVSALLNMELDADSGVVLNGVTYTSSAALAAAGFTLAAGTTTFAVSTFGQSDDAAANDRLTLAVTNGLLTQTLVISFVATDLTAVYTPTTVSGAAGASRTFALSVEDQWGETPVRSDLRIAASVVLGGSQSDTVSSAVVAGAASVTVTPVPATRTGSAVVTFTLQRFDQDTQAWVNFGTGDSATWNVFSYAAGTDAFVSRTASISASISYAADLSWSATAIAVRVANSFSDVVVSAPGLMIQNADVTTQTASDTLTVNAANGQTVNLKFTSRTAGTFTVTFTNGTATTTSQVVVNPARDADGATITFDTTAIAAGSTKVITGTLVDVNGNAVNTSGSATILVTYTVTGNAGIPIGTMPTETDADGKFTITVLTGANDSGTAVVSATYYKLGAATPVAQVLTFNQSIVVGGAATAPASDQKLTVGSFKGFVAIYALNYTGQKLSAKVAGKWLVVNELSKFQRVVRNTGAGFNIKVDLYIDGAFVRSETVVTK